MTDKVKTDVEEGCSINEIAKALALTPRRLQQLVTAGILPRPGKRGCYDLAKCVQAYSQHQRKELRRLRALKGKKKSFFTWSTESEKKDPESDAAFQKAIEEIDRMFGLKKKNTIEEWLKS